MSGSKVEGRDHTGRLAQWGAVHARFSTNAVALYMPTIQQRARVCAAKRAG